MGALTMRRWFPRVLAIVAIWIAVSHAAELERFVQVLQQGRWGWMLAAALVQVAYYLTYAALYQSAFNAVGIDRRIGELLPVVLASLFVNLAVPTGGVSGGTLFVDDTVRRGQSGPQAVAGILLAVAAELAAFMLLLIPGLWYLFTHDHLRLYEVAGAAVVAVVIGGLTGLIVVGILSPRRVRRWLEGWQGSLNRMTQRFLHRPLLADGWAARTAIEFSTAASAIAQRPSGAVRTAGAALAMHLLDLGTLYVLFLAFHESVGFGVLVSGYAIGILFWIVALTPQGIGVVEGVMALVYTSLRVPPERALAIALTFRGLTFWLPLLAGFVLLPRVRSFTDPQLPGECQP